MSVIEIYSPKFDSFREKPVVIWEANRGGIQVATDLYKQYLAWMNTKSPKDDPTLAFWESNGPAIVRALRYCGCHALVFWYEGDRKVSYKWFAKKTEVGPFGPTVSSGDRYYLCNVIAEGSCLHGNDTRVTVTLPTDEDVHFCFHQAEMATWFKPKEEIK